MIDSIFNNDIIETEVLNENADKVEKPGDAAAIINNMKTLFAQERKTLYPSRIIKENFLKDSKTRKSLSN